MGYTVAVVGATGAVGTRMIQQLEQSTSNPAIEVSVLKETKHLPHVEAPEAFLDSLLTKYVFCHLHVLLEKY